MSGRYFAVIDPSSPRRAHWLNFLGDDFAPLVMRDPVDEYQADGSTRPVYLIDATRLSHEVVMKIAEDRAAETGETIAHVVADIYANDGISVLAEDVRVCADPDEGRSYFQSRRIP